MDNQIETRVKYNYTSEFKYENFKKFVTDFYLKLFDLKDKNLNDLNEAVKNIITVDDNNILNDELIFNFFRHILCNLLISNERSEVLKILTFIQHFIDIMGKNFHNFVYVSVIFNSEEYFLLQILDKFITYPDADIQIELSYIFLNMSYFFDDIDLMLFLSEYYFSTAFKHLQNNSISKISRINSIGFLCNYFLTKAPIDNDTLKLVLRGSAAIIPTVDFDIMCCLCKMFSTLFLHYDFDGEIGDCFYFNNYIELFFKKISEFEFLSEDIIYFILHLFRKKEFVRLCSKDVFILIMKNIEKDDISPLCIKYILKIVNIILSIDDYSEIINDINIFKYIINAYKKSSSVCLLSKDIIIKLLKLDVNINLKTEIIQSDFVTNMLECSYDGGDFDQETRKIIQLIKDVILMTNVRIDDKLRSFISLI